MPHPYLKVAAACARGAGRWQEWRGFWCAIRKVPRGDLGRGDPAICACRDGCARAGAREMNWQRERRTALEISDAKTLKLKVNSVEGVLWPETTLELRCGDVNIR
jgi:hypothetical protein